MKNNPHREFQAEILVTRRECADMQLRGQLLWKGCFPDLVDCATVIGPSDVTEAKSNQVGFLIGK